MTKYKAKVIPNEKSIYKLYKRRHPFKRFVKRASTKRKSPFEYVDMSVKQPWDFQWKTNCRTKIKGCDGVVAIVTQNTRYADGQI